MCIRDREEIVTVEDGQAAVYGDTEISGVPGTGARIDETFYEPGGSVTGRMYPSGNHKDLFSVPGFETIEGTIVDAGTAVVFVKAEDLGPVSYTHLAGYKKSGACRVSDYILLLFYDCTGSHYRPSSSIRHPARRRIADGRRCSRVG